MANFAHQTVVKQTPQSQGDRDILCKFKDTVYLPVEEYQTTKSLTASVQSTLFINLFFVTRGQNILFWNSEKLCVDLFQPCSDKHFEKSSATV